LVVERDEGRCVRCGKKLFDEHGSPVAQYSMQHRRARGMGGSKAADTNQPQNLILLCGSATSPDCHQAVESRPSYAAEHGWRVAQWEDPLKVPVTSWRGPIWLRADGTWSHVTDAGSPGVVENPFTGAMERPVF
jgi:hypothetical protein